MNFVGTQFTGDADFYGARFMGNGNFNETQFKNEADFRSARFFGNANFISAQFEDDASFHGASFSCRAAFSRARVVRELDFGGCTLRNQLLFEGTEIAETAMVLLWDVQFALGVSDITGSIDDKYKSFGGHVAEPAGEVVFCDIPRGIGRVSFLHTHIYLDRPHIRFANVKWEGDPRRFVFDARFVFCKNASEWQSKTGLTKDEMEFLPRLFHTERQGCPGETEGQKVKRRAQELADCVPLVKQDVERIAREIRVSYERYGHYGDAGNYYIAEMDFRRIRTPRFKVRYVELANERRCLVRIWRTINGLLSSLSYRTALDFYRLCSIYGESPGRAVTSLLAALIGFGFVFVMSGFSFMGRTVHRELSWPPAWSQTGATISDVWLAFRMALANLMPGNLRGDVLGLENSLRRPQRLVRLSRSS